MAYRQYTKCVAVNDYEAAPYTEAIIVAVFSGIFLLSAIWTGLSGIDAALLALAAEALRWVKWWLYGRLICLGGDKCAVGVLVSANEPKGPIPDAWDTDYCFDILLAPDIFGVSQNDAEMEPQQGPLLKKDPQVELKDPKTGQTFGNTSSDCSNTDCPQSKCGSTTNCPGRDCAGRISATLHCEIEGAGMYNLIKPLEAVIGMTAVAEVLSWFCAVPVLGWIACLIAILLTIASAAVLIAGLTLAFNDSASPRDVNPDLADTLTTNDCNGLGADILLVSGEWIYDSFHNGNNEFHPVKHLQKVNNGYDTAPDGTMTPALQWEGQWNVTLPDDLTAWCSMVGNAGSLTTQTNQQKPENQWVVHPVLDGCSPAPVIQ